MDKRVKSASREEEERGQVTGVPTRDEAKRGERVLATVISRLEKRRARFVVRLEAGQMHLAFYREPFCKCPPVLQHRHRRHSEQAR
ncbi:hypothetical protein ALC57_05910 [Trachymyrmex cornetzi]|uniref:Uncharacterized protein n=1 Tax=Trachymyrmex cornetzi TaxID=471704 RepID=A0A151J9G3_9HYME|nr:hypothetical protein ALC57_05910 [Trachymyrmex cornetzi]